MIKHLLTVFIFSSLAANAQTYQNIDKAEKAMSKTNYKCAAYYLKQAVQVDPDNLYAHYRLGKALYQLNQYEEAISHYETAKPLMKDSMNYHFDMYHLYSVAGLGAFAKQSFIQYVYLCPSCVKGDLLPGVKSNKLLYKQPIKDPVVMGYESDNGEYYPYIMNDNRVQHLIVKGDPSKPSHADEIRSYMTKNFANKDFLFYNSSHYKQKNKKNGCEYGPYSLSADQKKIYITRWDSKKSRIFIYSSTRVDSTDDKGWNKFYPLSIELDNGASNFTHPMITKDGKHLVFASDISGGLGGYDLWMGDITTDLNIKNIKNLGTYVNTPGDELFPSVYDDDVLFFASSGHYGYGKLDLYAGIRYKDKFRKTYNLGNRFNSIDDDYSLFYNHKKKQGFFTSNRFRSVERDVAIDRIYSQGFDKIQVNIDIVDQNNKAAKGMQVMIPSENIKATTDENGKVAVFLSPVGYKKLLISGDKYFSIDTILFPFDSRLSLKTEKRAPKDVVDFKLVSHPYENVLTNTPYILTSEIDGKRYFGTSDEYGNCQTTLYAEEPYTIDILSIDFKQKGIDFKNPSSAKIFAKSDRVLVKSEPTSSANSGSNTSIVEEPLTESYTLYYESGQWVLTDNMNRQIQNTVRILSQNPNYKLELTAHTDCQGSPAINSQLSKMRLEEARRLYFGRGVAESQIVGKFVGEASPANTCKCDEFDNYNCSSEEMKKNRRTEIRIIK